MDKQVKRPRGRPKGYPKSGGRPKGSPNKITRALKDAILNAFETVGGEDYLAMIARTKPETFCSLLGRVLPLQVTGDPDAPVVTEIRQVIVDPANSADG